jgi:4-hydroxybenzoate polyprenyltransferase
VLAAFLFALGAREVPLDLPRAWRVGAAALLFCLAASGIYLLNDLCDATADRIHPVKRNRPIAAGRIRPAAAGLAAAVLLALSLGAAALLSRPFAIVLSAYTLMQLAYTLFLKRVTFVDVMIIASGFVLRALAGAVVIAVTISPWLLLCAFLLALFLALCKRRHEKVSLDANAVGHRPVLEGYAAPLLDQLIAIVSAATIVCYAIYTLWPDTVHKFGSPFLGFTVPFVVFGIFRYLALVYQHDQGGRPERILLTDGPLLVDLALYGLAVLAIFAWTR